MKKVAKSAELLWVLGFLFVAFGVAVLYGYALDLFLWILGGIVIDAVWMQYLLLIVGDMLIAFGVACFFRTYLPLRVLRAVRRRDRASLPLQYQQKEADLRSFSSGNLNHARAGAVP